LPSVWAAYCIFRDEEERAMRALIAIALLILPFLGRSSAQDRKVHHHA